MTDAPSTASYAVLTASGPAAIAVVAVWGNSAAGLLSNLTGGNTPPERIPDCEFRLARWLGPDRVGGSKPADAPSEDVLVCRIDGQSFEVHCHGGTVATQRIARDLERLGARNESPAEWLARTMPWHAVRCQLALAACTTARTAELVLRQEDNWRRLVGQLRSGQESGVANSRLLATIDRALEWNEAGQRSSGRKPLRLTELLAPESVILFGPPNAGKSSLLNRLAGFERSIVHPEAGTTRDLVTSQSAIDGWPVVLTDTAGLRSASQAVERAGVKLAVDAIHRAALRLLVVDCSCPPKSGEWNELLAFRPDLVLANKTDLAPVPELPGGFDPKGVSARTGAGMDELLGLIGLMLNQRQPPADLAVPLDDEMLDWLKSVQTALRLSNDGAMVALLDGR